MRSSRLARAHGDLARVLRPTTSVGSTSNQVIVGFDFSHSGRAALHRAIALATRAPFHVLHFVCVIEPRTPIPAVPTDEAIDYTYADRVQQALSAEIETELRRADVTGRVQFYVHVRIGKPAAEILIVARDVGADLIIVGSRGMTGLERLVVGSVSEHVVREAGCSVEVARPKTYSNVELLKIHEVEPHLTYIPPHRYSYEDGRLSPLAPEWPVY